MAAPVNLITTVFGKPVLLSPESVRAVTARGARAASQSFGSPMFESIFKATRTEDTLHNVYRCLQYLRGDYSSKRRLIARSDAPTRGRSHNTLLPSTLSLLTLNGPIIPPSFTLSFSPPLHVSVLSLDTV